MSSCHHHRLIVLRAFTLIEMLLVAVIIGIAAAIVVPALGESDNTRVVAAARLLIADLGFAQVESITHPDNLVGLRFDASADSYALVTKSGGSFDCATANTITEPITGDPYLVQFGSGRGSQLNGVEISTSSTGGDACIVFGALGQLDQSATAVITLQAGTASVVINVDPVSGEATTP